MDFDWLYLSYLPIQIFCIIYGTFSLTRAPLPIKVGLQEKNQKLVTKGVAYLVIGTVCIFIFLGLLLRNFL